MENRFLTTIKSKNKEIPKALLDFSNITLNSNDLSNINTDLNSNLVDLNQSIRSTPIKSSRNSLIEDKLNQASNIENHNPQPSIRQIKYNALPNAAKAKANKLILVITNTNKKPSTYKIAIRGLDAALWFKGIKAEVDKLEAQKT